MTSAFVWNVSPEILRVGPFALRWYGVLFALAFIIGLAIGRAIYRREGKSRENLDLLLMYILAGTLVGARIGHCLFYEPAYYLKNPLEILMIWRGGLASHGGVAGILCALFIYCRRHPEDNFWWILDRLTIPVALGAGMIRLGNLFNSEIIGMPTHVPWAVIFARVSALPRHPVMVYEAAIYFGIFVLFVALYMRKGPDVPKYLLTGLFLTLVFSARFFLEFFKAPQADFEVDLPLRMGQLLSLPLIACGIGLLVLSRLHFLRARSARSA